MKINNTNTDPARRTNVRIIIFSEFDLKITTLIMCTYKTISHMAWLKTILGTSGPYLNPICNRLLWINTSINRTPQLLKLELR